MKYIRREIARQIQSAIEIADNIIALPWQMMKVL